MEMNRASSLGAEEQRKEKGIGGEETHGALAAQQH